jgi:hypothetical protein
MTAALAKVPPVFLDATEPVTSTPGAASSGTSGVVAPSDGSADVDLAIVNGLSWPTASAQCRSSGQVAGAEAKATCRAGAHRGEQHSCARKRHTLTEKDQRNGNHRNSVPLGQ